MNVSMAIEAAFSEAWVQASPFDGISIRTWQSIDADGRWDPNSDRKLPLLDIRASTPEVSVEDLSRKIDLNVTCSTNSSDDQTHTTISMMYDSVLSVIETIFSDYRAGNYNSSSNPITKAFREALENQLFDGPQIVVGGFEIIGGNMPETSEGLNTISAGISVHYYRR